RFGIEHAALDETNLAPDDVVARRRVANERDAVDEVLLAFLQPERHVHNGRTGRRRRGSRRARGVRIRVAVGRRGTSWREIGIPGEVHVATGAVDFLGLLEALPDLFLAVDLPLFNLEQGA